MLKVECESCKAPYQIDERRVPQGGLKMRCPKCGHSFLVLTNRLATPAVPAPAAAVRPRPSPSPLPSDFPASLGSLDEPDLPVVSPGLPAAKVPSADLPTAKKGPPRPPPRPTLSGKSPAVTPTAKRDSFEDLDMDLPAVLADLPSAVRSSPRGPPPLPSDLDLPLPGAELPMIRRAPDIDLPSPVGDLPVIAASLPVVAAPLPVVSAPLPVTERGFGELDLPTVGEALPADRASPKGSQDGVGADSSSFGEIELPRGPPPLTFAPAVTAPSTTGARGGSADFGSLELDEKPRSQARVSSRPQVPIEASRGGGMTFGEVDLSSAGGSGADASSISVVAPFPLPPEPTGAPGARARPESPGAAPLPPSVAHRAPVRDVPAVSRKRRSIGPRVGLAVLVLAVLGGASLQLTPHGAFGYLTLADRLHAKDYERALLTAADAAELAFAVDTYDQAKSAVDAVVAAHGRTPRARRLTAYAAFVDFATTVRFGPDTARAPRGKELVSQLPPEERSIYRDVALAAQAAANDDLDRARKGLDAAIASAAKPLKVEILLLLGDIALTQKDSAAALAAFQGALALSSDARAHFGLARAHDARGDAAGARREIEATLAASAQHAGALTLRARMSSAPTDEAQALRDLALVIDGPVRAKAAPIELSRAYAARAWVSLDRGSVSEARDAFAQAVKIDPRNISALSGEGRLFLGEGRYTEALARFDAALQADPSSPEAVADDAEAKLALDRLADAKQQLTDARQRFPKSFSIALLLGRVEQHLGNRDAAEADIRAAMAMVDPARRDAVLPYVALSELLLSRGRLMEAKAVLDDARKNLAPSGALDRALGDVAELEGEHDAATALYRAAIVKDPRDVASHFRLAVVLRRQRKLDEAGAELDRVVEVDKDYPGLALERGQLYEESGDVEKAIAEFKGALARAPDDPDLQLRVGTAYVAIGRPDDAIPMLRKVLQERPNSAEAYHYYGRALMLKGPSMQADALHALKKAVDLDPNRAEFHVYLAWAANEAGQIELARDEVDRALSIDKLNAEGFWQRGDLEFKQGAIRDAIADEKRALELRPSRYEAHATLAECYGQENDEATALAEWKKAIDPDGDAVEPDGGLRHARWRYEYGKLLMIHAHADLALKVLLPAAEMLEKSDQRPAWLAPLEFYTAQALDKAGRRAPAVEHYRTFLDIALVNSPDRPDAEKALKRLGATR